MTDAHNIEIVEALQFVANADLPSQHKKVLMEVLQTALRDAEARAGAVAPLHSRGRWEQHEIETIAAHLKGKTARNWQHADEMAIRLAALLHRSPDDVRGKATELGLGAGIDYRAAMSLRATEASLTKD